ncbi:MAG: GNAT family N-acetyltransferase [Phycisphaeraceae bacterium]
MSEETTMRVVSPDDELPPGAVSLLGHEVEELFAAARAGEAEARPGCVAAERGGACLAAALVKLETVESGEKVASIEQLVIPPAERGRGLAGRLIRTVMGWADAEGCGRIRSTAGWGCPDHLRFYRRMKFESADPDERPYLVSRRLD